MAQKITNINPINPDHIYQITTLGPPSISPDGTKIAYSSSFVHKKSFKNISRIVITSLNNPTNYFLTQGNSDHSPIYSPDGNNIAFIRQDLTGNNQLWLIPTNGGESRKLTQLPGGIGSPSWSPNGRAIVFTSLTSTSEPGNDYPTMQTKLVSRIKYRTDQDGWIIGNFHHIFIVDLGTEAVKQLTFGESNNNHPAWSHDSKQIAFLSDREENQDISWKASVYSIGIDDDALVQWSTDVWCFNEGSISGNVTWSPADSELIIIGSDDEEWGDSRQNSLFICDKKGMSKKFKGDKYTAVLPTPPLTHNTKGNILLLADYQGESFICEANINDYQIRPVIGGKIQYTAMSITKDGNSAAILASHPKSPNQIYHANLSKRSITPVTTVNETYFQTHPPGKMQKFFFKRNLSRIESRLILPPSFSENIQYPLILDVHGGPASRFQDSFDSRQHVLATAGYIVLAVNPRGSSSYGLDFTKAVLGDWGGEDYLDLIEAVDKISSKNYVDQNRLGIHGFSYGGFMSAWAIGQTDRFRAAVIGAPVINLLSMYGTSDIGVSFGESHWGGKLADNIDKFIDRSPLKYVNNITTPVLLLHGEKDYRCPIGQSEEFFVSLKRLNREVEFIRFPDCNHSFARSGPPKMKEAYLTNMKLWFDKHLTDEKKHLQP